jgi:pSer/pThr/pTyr-binding forkhead associated (FHA) protein
MASLYLLAEDGTLADQWELGAEALSVGRDASADVIIDDQSLSRRHFLIECKGGNYLLTDLNSSNGTWVDGRAARSEPTPLHHHDCIAAGRTLFLFNEQPVQGQHSPLRN